MITHLNATRIELLRNLPKQGIGAELGVFRGDYSREILRWNHPRHLYLVDQWNTNGAVISAGVTADLPQERARLAQEFARAPVEFVTCDSALFLKMMQPNSLDWVYIDTIHTYEQTWKELSAAHTAVKVGGIIAGHDFSIGMFPGVVQSVLEYAQDRDLTIYEGDHDFDSFWIVNH